MDLGAYVQIADLDTLAKANGIEVNRLRGYRLMKDEEPVDIAEICKDKEVEFCEELCRMKWDPNSPWSSWGPDTDAYCRTYINNYDKRSEDGVECSVNWDAMLPEEQEILHSYIEKRLEQYRTQWELWNSFCGKANVLYIHARQGTSNWSETTFHNYEKEPWYLGGCNDAYDSSYCDMYAKVQPIIPGTTVAE